MKSRVKWFNEEKGFGFIEFNETEDIFVHYSQIKCDGFKTLREGDEVDFRIINTAKGLQAQEVTALTACSDLVCS